MATIILGSIVRNGTGYLNRHFDQALSLRDALARQGHALQIHITEGDSGDGSWEYLVNRSKETRDLYLYRYNHGGPAFGSVSNPVRWRNIARTWNHMLDRISDRAFDTFIYMEADLIWSTATVLRLLDDIRTVPAVAPLSMDADETRFRDTWGYRYQGRHFSGAKPYHPGLPNLPAEDRKGALLRIHSAGSCAAMWGEVARECRLAERDAMIGWDIYEEGYSMWLDPEVRVVHP